MATANTAIIIALLITALFIFIFYPSPILFGNPKNCFPVRDHALDFNLRTTS
jgi:hypothetical protein